MDGVAGLKGWNWIFIIEGILTCVVAAAGYWFIQPWPSQAKFLSVEEHSLLNARLKADSDTVNEEAFAWSEVFAAFKDPKCWLYCALFHTCSLPLYTLSLFLVSHTPRSIVTRPEANRHSHRSLLPWVTQPPTPSSSQFRHTPSQLSSHSCGRSWPRSTKDAASS